MLKWRLVRALLAVQVAFMTALGLICAEDAADWECKIGRVSLIHELDAGRDHG